MKLKKIKVICIWGDVYAEDFILEKVQNGDTRNDWDMNPFYIYVDKAIRKKKKKNEVNKKN